MFSFITFALRISLDFGVITMGITFVVRLMHLITQNLEVKIYVL